MAKISFRAMGLAVLLVLALAAQALAATGGSILGSISDASGVALPSVQVELVSDAQQTIYRTISDRQGKYTFPQLPVGRYTITFVCNGFATKRKYGLAVDSDASLRVDTALEIATRADTITVSGEAALSVDTVTTHLGEAVTAEQMTAIPLNGRSYTDLLAMQPGVAPISTLVPSSVIMAGVTGSIDPSGDENPGNLSIDGQRESSNGFMVNGVDVHEPMNGGTSVLPNLDSIEQFRVLTNNFDPEYGNYNGGMVNVITRSGSNSLHGKVFEFFRNTDLDARGYFDPTRPAFRQNQFGGTLGGPLRHDRLFFFMDYQGTRTTQGVSTGNISVPTAAERNGIFNQGELTGSVSGPYLASLLTQELGYTVAAGEPYTSVFPGGVIPQAAWSAPAKNLLHYIPSPNVGGANQFASSAGTQTVRDDKGSARLDASTALGRGTAYYFVDDYGLDNPYPGSVAGASIPGFDALYLGRAQLLSFADTKIFGAKTVNEAHVGYLRNANVIGQPHGGLGVSLAAQGFSNGTSGIFVQAPQFEGVENITFPTFVMGVPITNETQVNNTVYASDGLSRVFGAHTFKAGVQFHNDEVNEHPNATFNGTFNINGTETGSAYADFLLGTPSNFTQSSGQPFYLRNRYAGFYAQDSWRANDALTVNAGLRWDLIEPWWEKYNQIQTWIAGTHHRVAILSPRGLGSHTLPPSTSASESASSEDAAAAVCARAMACSTPHSPA
jgi:hypothetical protein